MIPMIFAQPSVMSQTLIDDATFMVAVRSSAASIREGLMPGIALHNNGIGRSYFIWRFRVYGSKSGVAGNGHKGKGHIHGSPG